MIAIRTSACAVLLTLSLMGVSHAEDTEVKITVEPSALPAFVAQREGLFKGIKVDVTQVGYAQVQALLVSGETDVAWMSPLETMEFVSEGSDFRYFSTAGSQNMYNGVVVRAADADKYHSIEDLKGKKLGVPGYGTGTWAIFQTFARAFYGVDDSRSTFKTVAADSGALLALLERGDIDAALLLSGTSAVARSSPQFKTIFSFTEDLQKRTGQPLTVNGAVATASWLEKNPHTVASLVAGLDAGVQWMVDHPEAFARGGKYQDLAQAVGWLKGDKPNTTIQTFLREGKWYLTSANYTQAWIDTVTKLAQEGKLVAKIPPSSQVFWPPQKQ